jgi:methyl-accepting chemotaxis protein
MNVQEVIAAIKEKVQEVETVQQETETRIDRLTEIKDKAENVAGELDEKAEDLESISRLMDEADDVIYKAEDEGISI